MNLLNEKIKTKKSRRNFISLIVLQCIILSLLLSCQYYYNRVQMEKILKKQEILLVNMQQSNFNEKVEYGTRKKLIETFEYNQKILKSYNDDRHQAMNSALEILHVVAKDPNINLTNIYLQGNLIEIKGSARKKTDIDRHFSHLDLPHYGKFEPLEYNNYSQDRYQFILKNELYMNGGSGDE